MLAFIKLPFLFLVIFICLLQTEIRAQQARIKWIVPDEVDYSSKPYVTDKAALEVKIDIAVEGISIQPSQLRLLRNGQPYEAAGQKLGEIKVKVAGKQNLRFIETVMLEEGESSWQLEILLPGQPGLRSQPIRMVLSTGKPNLYLICVGVPYALDYAKQDASAVFDIFKTQAGHLFGSVQGELLICDKETSRGKIAQTIVNLQAEQLTSKDVVILFFSGHGKPMNAFGNGDFGLVTNDAAQGVLEDELVLLSYKENIIKYITPLPCKRLILLDACHSGITAGAKQWSGSFREAQKAIASSPPGIITLASSSGAESSYEDIVWKHGAFTYSLLEGLNGGADASKDGSVTVTELGNYLSRTVPVLVQNQKSRSQHPWLANGSDLDFPIFNYHQLSPLVTTPADRCESTAITLEPPVSVKPSASALLVVGNVMDDDLTMQLIEKLEIALSDFSWKQAGAKSLKNLTLEKNTAAYTCVADRMPTIYRQESHNGSDRYWIAQVPLQLTFYETRTGEKVYSTKIEGKFAQGADFDKSSAELNALQKALETIGQKKIIIKK